MTERDADGRITKLDPDDPTSYIMMDGHRSYIGDAICQHPGCGKVMLRVWDVVCSVCDRPFCYSHARSDRKHWFCLADAPRP